MIAKPILYAYTIYNKVKKTCYLQLLVKLYFYKKTIQQH